MSASDTRSGSQFFTRNVPICARPAPVNASREEVITRNVGGMTSFGDTMPYRVKRFIEQLNQGTTPDQLEGTGAEALAAQEVIEAAIRSWETGTVVHLPLVPLSIAPTEISSRL